MYQTGQNEQQAFVRQRNQCNIKIQQLRTMEPMVHLGTG